MKDVGSYITKPYSKHRRNIEIVTTEGWKKRATHAVLEIDVTDAKEKIKKYKEKKGIKISFTGWVIRCIADAMSKNKQLNAYKNGRKKIIEFDDVDVAVPIEKKYKDEFRPGVYILRNADKKTTLEITKEIRKVQKEQVGETSQVYGKKLSFLERFALNSPKFFQKMLLIIVNRNAKLKKKYMGTTAVTAIGMKGKFPGWVVPLGGTATTLFVVGGISKKPFVVKDKIMIREILHLTITTDHYLVDGGPLVRFIDYLINIMEDGFDLEK